jgi:hypothetical protein
MQAAVLADSSAEAGPAQEAAAAEEERACSVRKFAPQVEVQQQGHVVVCSSDGALDVLHVHAAAGSEADVQQLDSGGGAEGVVGVPQAVTAAAQTVLPGELYSSPVFVNDWLVLGCRDDHLHCLKLAQV